MTKRNNERLNLRILFFLLLFLLEINFVNKIFGQQESQTKPPLSFQQIELLIKAQTPDNVIAGEISRRGLSFETSKDMILNLTQIGAGPKTIEAINNFRSWLNDAKEVIPENLKRIFQALNEGNPGKIKHLLAGTLFSESTALDSICIPFRYRAHYIESIIERPDDEYIAIVRVLYNPLNEQAKNITFKRIHDNFIMVRVGDYEEIKKFEIWKEEAMAISLKLFYALKASRWDVISELRSSEKISFNPLLKSWGVGVDDMKYVNKTADIVSNKGIKVRTKLEIMSNQIGYYAEFDIFLEPISNEFKVVGWAVNSYRISEFDPDIEEYTLNRFTKKLDLLDSGSKIPTAEKSMIPAGYVTDSASIIYEAEEAKLEGSAQVNNNHMNFSGSGFVDGYGYMGLGSKTTFNVQIPNDGIYEVTLRYANARGSAMTVSIYANGAKVKRTILPSLDSWDKWADKTELIAFKSGQNLIAYKYDEGDSGNINIDCIRISK